jgi:site-specific DNA recombinase
MRRGRQAKLRSGTLLPWTLAPYGYILDPERPRDPSRVRLDPAKAEIVKQIFAWYTDPEIPATLYWVAKTLSDRQIPTPHGGLRWNVASVRGILRSPAYTGTAYSGRTHPAPAQRRKSALQPVGRGESQQPAPVENWIAVQVPAIVSQEIFDLAQHRLEQNKQMARRNNSEHDYLLRGLVSCGQCQLASTGRLLPLGYAYYVCRGRTDALRAAQGARCTARYVPADALDQLVWQDLCRLLADPTFITHELARAQAGEWLPQALQDRQRALRSALAQLERQQTRLLEVYLAEVIGRDEFERKRQEVAQMQSGLMQQLRQLEAQAQKQLDTAKLTASIEEFCRRLQPTLDQLNFAQRRQLVELLIDRVIVDNETVEIRYVIPTAPTGEHAPFCHLRKDYLDIEAQTVLIEGRNVGGFITDDEPGFGVIRPTSQGQVDWTQALGRDEDVMPEVGTTRLQGDLAQLEHMSAAMDQDVGFDADTPMPSQPLQVVDEIAINKATISQEDDAAPQGEQLGGLIEQVFVDRVGYAAAVVLQHHPNQRHSSPTKDD